MKKASLLLIILSLLWGCVTFSPSYKLGYQAELNKKWDDAIRYYERASLENPKESVYRLALIRAKISASLYHLQEARKLTAEGKKEEAQKEYDQAIAYDPSNRAVAMEASSLAKGEGKKEVAEIKRIEYPIKLKVSKEKLDLKFPTDTMLRSIFIALGKHSRVNFIFDERFKDLPIVIDLTGKDFEEAVNHLCLATRHFYRILDEKTVIIIPDLPEKRFQYDLNAIRTFYLSNINAQDIQGALSSMLRTQYKAPTIMVDKNLNSITVRDTPQNIEMAERLMRVWDKPKGEVVIDLEIMEVSRVKLRQLGINLDQNIIGLRYGGAQPSKDGWYNLKDIDFSKSSNYELSLPVSFLQFLESDADTKIIAQPRLRGVADEEIKSVVGQKVPIPQTTFSPIAAGGISQQPVTSFTYENVGIEIKIKPKVHFEKEITLELELKVTSIGGTGIADIPIITTREVKNTLRLKDGETNLLAGLLRDEERKSLKGIAGIKDIPLLGRLFSTEDTTLEKTDVILTITPYIIRSIPLSDEDMKPIWVDLEGISTSPRPEIFGQEDIEQERARLLERPEIEMPGREEEGQNQVFISPVNFEVPQGREFRMSVNLRSSQEVANMSLSLSFNPNVMKLKDVVEGGIIRQLGEKVPFLKNISGGTCTIGFSSPQLGKGVKGGGNLAMLVFDAAAQGESALEIGAINANGPTGQMVKFQAVGARVAVR